MTRWLMAPIAVCLLALPACALAGNWSPTLYFEVYYQVDDPADPEGAGLPATACAHPRTYPISMPCWAPRLAGYFYIIPLHVGKLDNPICPVPGPGCATYGGYVGVGFGATVTNNVGVPQTAPMFIRWNVCPGFLKGPSTAGEPAACLAYSTAGCRDWTDHEGYLLYLNLSGTTERRINIVVSADFGHNKVINCASTYDEGTAIGAPGGIQVSTTQTYNCDGMPVEEATWGEIKALFR